MKAMILAAGLGTRMKPLTDHKPKALVEIAGMTLLEKVINRLTGFGIEDIIINVHHFGEQIIEFLNEKNNFGINIFISDERGELLDTGGGIAKASWFFDDGEPFLVHNVDVLTELDFNKMLDFHKQKKALVTLAVSKRQSSRYLLFDPEMRLKGWVNVKTHEKKLLTTGEMLVDFAFSGIHIIEPAFFALTGHKKRFYIIDEYLRLAKDFVIAGYDHSGVMWLDIGTPDMVEYAEKYYNLT